MAPTDEKAGEASPASEASMMPTLPDPWEGLVRAYGAKEYTRGATAGDEDGPHSVYLAANHAAFEAERALRMNLLALLAGSEKPAAS